MGFYESSCLVEEEIPLKNRVVGSERFSFDRAGLFASQLPEAHQETTVIVTIFVSGRQSFWTMDVWESRRCNPIGLHKYLYAGSNPVSNIDPKGLNSYNPFVPPPSFVPCTAQLSHLPGHGLGGDAQFQWLCENAGCKYLTNYERLKFTSVDECIKTCLHHEGVFKPQTVFPHKPSPISYGTAALRIGFWAFTGGPFPGLAILRVFGANQAIQTGRYYFDCVTLCPRGDCFEP